MLDNAQQPGRAVDGAGVHRRGAPRGQRQRVVGVQQARRDAGREFADAVAGDGDHARQARAPTPPRPRRWLPVTSDWATALDCDQPCRTRRARQSSPSAAASAIQHGPRRGLGLQPRQHRRVLRALAGEQQRDAHRGAASRQALDALEPAGRRQQVGGAAGRQPALDEQRMDARRPRRRVGRRGRRPRRGSGARAACASRRPCRPPRWTRLVSSTSAIAVNSACSCAPRSSAPARRAARSAGSTWSNSVGRPCAASSAALRRPCARAARAPCESDARRARDASASPQRASSVARRCRRVAGDARGARRARRGAQQAQREDRAAMRVDAAGRAQHARLGRDAQRLERRERGAAPRPAPRRARRSGAARTGCAGRCAAFMSSWLPASANDTRPGLGSSASSSYSETIAARPERRVEGARVGARRRVDIVRSDGSALMPSRRGRLERHAVQPLDQHLRRTPLADARATRARRRRRRRETAARRPAAGRPTPTTPARDATASACAAEFTGSSRSRSDSACT